MFCTNPDKFVRIFHFTPAGIKLDMLWTDLKIDKNQNIQ